MTHLTFNRLLQDYRRDRLADDLAGMWGVVLFFRLPGMILARAAIALGVPAMALTLLGLTISLLIGLVGALSPPATAILLVAVLGALFQIVDCADGTVARATGTTSRAGAFVDFGSDLLWRMVCLAAIGHAADRMAPDDQAVFLQLGLLAGFLATFARLLRVRAEGVNPASPPAGSGTPPRRATLARLVFSALSGLDELLPLIALVAHAQGWLPVLIAGTVVYHGLDALLAFATGYARLRQADAASRPTGSG
jgi:phosphatidylglycerophosphate synthase